jgi:hypothetical protein
MAAVAAILENQLSTITPELMAGFSTPFLPSGAPTTCGARAKNHCFLYDQESHLIHIRSLNIPVMTFVLECPSFVLTKTFVLECPSFVLTNHPTLHLS